MPTTLGRGERPRLEGLCEETPATGRRVRIGRGADGIERVEAAFTGQAFSPHRHDTYAIGLTLAGVQAFIYRGRRRHCLPGEGQILHPDEMHDGGTGSGERFGYRIVYVDPSLVQQALGGRALPFVADPVVGRGDLDPALLACLADIDAPIGELERVELAVVIAGLLERLSAARPVRRTPLPLASLLRVRDLVAEDPTVQHPLAELERVADLDRWTIARRFRAAFGTSPSRFRTMRQLDQARRMMAAGTPLSEAALAAGFADQSHMSRMFKRTYGLTPARWAAALTPPAGAAPPRGPARP